MIFYLSSSWRFLNFSLVQEILGKKGVNLADFPCAHNDENYPLEAKYLLNENEIQKLP